eukprot:TRINITY_DN25953_c0_g1_i1.p1 TRINITY_DN25953_c0_g1~~TRINITY_DN25953_c0_g1_i1.p1  ORF type:complete len:844 (+),score=145.27 TRINITY_DN25953_c0_g1_i1:200-2731(+)
MAPMEDEMTATSADFVDDLQPELNRKCMTRGGFRLDGGSAVSQREVFFGSSGRGRGAIASSETFIGSIKSYNDRRGFGFVACPETAERYGRDVYIAKAEAQAAAIEKDGEAAAGFATPGAMPAFSAMEKAPNAWLREDDLVSFRVRLSVEGFPQAAEVHKLTKYRGRISAVPQAEGDGFETMGLVQCPELEKPLGVAEIRLRQAACGQLRLDVGDEVTFCVPELQGDGQVRDAQRHGPSSAQFAFEGKHVVLARTNRDSGSVLGCFSLTLPRPFARQADQKLDCHAFADKIILAGLASNTTDEELMRFFQRHGASQTIVAHARGCSFASVSFPNPQDIARLLARGVHAFADDNDTKLARLTPQVKTANSPHLPALPSPAVSPCGNEGSLVVSWSPLLLAVGYEVQLRNASLGEQQWMTVDPSTGKLAKAPSKMHMFTAASSSCKVMSLNSSQGYEARVIYHAACGCCSEPSEPSDVLCPSPSQAVSPAQQTSPNQRGQAWKPEFAVPNGCSPQACGAPWQGGWQDQVPRQGFVVAGEMCPPMGYGAFCMQGTAPAQFLRCMHGSALPLAPQPTLRADDESGNCLIIQWPAAMNVSSYVIQLQEVGSTAVDRFTRAVPMATMGSLIEMRVGGIAPAGTQGRFFTATIRCVSSCGCESNPSSPGSSPALGVCEVGTPGPAMCQTNSSLGGVSTPSVSEDPPRIPMLHDGDGISETESEPRSPASSAFIMTPQQSIGSVHLAGNDFAYGSGWLGFDASPVAKQNQPMPAGFGQLPGMPMPNSGYSAELPLQHIDKDRMDGGMRPHGGPHPNILTTGIRKAAAGMGGLGKKEPPPEVTGQEECLILD